ncbi:MAG: calcium/sodium antiporter [Thermoplasmatota archaeon]
MLWDMALFVLGIAILVGGAEVLVRGGSKVALSLGMSPLMIGLTVVAIGTSAPELVVSVTASATGHPEVALGNVVGSNILNTMIVLGITAMVYPVVCQRETVRKDLPMVVGASGFVLLVAIDGVISFIDGMLLLAGMFLYLRHLYEREQGRSDKPPRTEQALLPAVMAVLAGAGMLVVGGDFVVDSGTRIAAAFGVPERVIALTLVAFGTSAPELATSLVAAFRKEVDLAVGNVVGSNLLNIFLVLGGASMVASIPVAGSIWFDLAVMTGSALLLLQFASSRFDIRRSEGVAFVVLYAGYLAFLLR